MLALSEWNQSAPASRLTFKIKIKKAPEVRGAQSTELGNGCQVLRDDNSLVNLSFEPDLLISGQTESWIAVMESKFVMCLIQKL